MDAVKRQAVIRYNKTTNMWEVHIGIAIYFWHPSLTRCKLWCDEGNTPIRNRGEVNRVLYENMPIQEMWE